MERPATPVRSPIRSGAVSPGLVHKHEQEMFQTPRWNDVWAAITFLLHFLAFLVLIVIGFAQGGSHVKDLFKSLGEAFKLSTYMIVQLSITFLMVTMLSIIFLYLIRTSPQATIHWAYMLNVAWLIFLGIIMIIWEQVLGGIINLVFALVIFVLWFLARSRIPFTAQVLTMVMQGVRSHPNVFTASILAAILNIGLSISTILAILVFFNTYEDTKQKVFFYYSIFAYYWTSQVISNVLYTTISGVFATAYFIGSTGQKVRAATRQSFRRAISYSFGSICLGSLIVAILRYLRFLARGLGGRNSITGLIMSCILSLVESLMRYFNIYAFTQVAIYGKSYIQAAKDTYALIKHRGIDAIINDQLVGTTTTMIALFIGICTTGISYIISHQIYDMHSLECLGLGILFGVMAFGLCSIIFSVIDAGATTMFVCLAEDPAALQRNDPAMYNVVIAKYENLVV